MSFETNIQADELEGAGSKDIPAAQLDDAREFMESRRLHPVTLLLKLVMSIPVLIFLLLPFLFGDADGGAWGSLVFIIVYAAIAFPISILQYLRFSYWITPREIVIQSGVLKRNNRSIPIERVQNIQIIQSLIPRIFGTARVKIETAGSASTEGVLEYVKVAEAQRLRQAVRVFQREKVEASRKEAGDEFIKEKDVQRQEPTPEQERTLLYKMPLARVMLSGMFRFSLLFIALIFSLLTYIPDFETLLFQWMEEGQFQWIAEAAAESIVLTVFATAFVAAVLAWVTGALLNLNRYYGFELWQEEDKLYRKHGLLTHSEGNIPLTKVQALVLRSNPLMRWFGWYVLELQTMGVDRDNRGNQVAIPFAKRHEILQIAQHIRHFELPEEFEPVSPLHIRRLFVRYGVMFSLATAAVAHFIWAPLWWAFTLLPLLLVYCYFRYRNHGFSASDSYFFVEGGVFRYRVWVLPTEKHQVFYNSSSIFQRRLQLKSLAVDTAGASDIAFPDVQDLPRQTADEMLDALYYSFHSFSQHSSPRKTSHSNKLP